MSATTLERSAPIDVPAAPVKAQPVSWKRTVLRFGGAAIILLVGVVAWRWWTVGRFIESTDDAYVGGEVTALAPQVPGFDCAGRGHRQSARQGGGSADQN
ncbi:MAG: hypothetical protein QM796_17280 [Chthoniobacteraceae bacterium]